MNVILIESEWGCEYKCAYEHEYGPYAKTQLENSLSSRSLDNKEQL